MKKQILNLGKALNKAEQKLIKGGYDYIPCSGTSCNTCPTERFCNGSHCVPCKYDTQNRPCCHP
jgi:hypothetical protein